MSRRLAHTHMESSPLIVLVTAAGASFAAIAAAAIDKFRKVLAGCFALAGGIVPWLFFAMWYKLVPSSTALSVISIFGSAPLFLIAFFLYGLGERTPMRGVASGASLVGMFAGIGFSAFLFGLLSRME